MNKSVKTLLIVLCAIFAVIFLFSGYKLYSTLHGYKVAEKSYTELSDKYVSAQAPAPDSKDDGPVVYTEFSPIHVDFDSMLAENSDVRGWIYSPDTVINYPIAQTEDNDYYLHRLLNGDYNANGTLFIDWLCEGDFSSDNTLIYGHHMNDGSMFAGLPYYRDQAYADAHPTMYINTPEQNYRMDIFAGYTVPAKSDIYAINFSSDAEFAAYIIKVLALSDFKTDVKVTPADHIVTLSTCTYEYADARYIIQGKLTPIG